MMELEVSYSLENAEQFWTELDDILSTRSTDHELIDNCLRAYLAFTTNFKEDYLKSESDITQCTNKLLNSDVFKSHQDYVRRQILYGLLQEDDAPTLHIIATFLLQDGRTNEEIFEMMQEEGAFPRLVELTQTWGNGEQMELHRLLLELMYEMSRIQRLTWEDLSSVDDGFIHNLLSIIESVSFDASDPYHYPVIRVLLVLNEQYMVSSALSPPGSTQPLTNRVLKAISTHLTSYKTFGENLILLLNRESETSLQLLILKLLYLLFSTKATAEYFYTNDLYVLLDVILRNLLDLPAEDDAMQALRHTYLRVLFPLLANSQLRREGMGYKRTETLQVLRVLSGDVQGPHFAPVDATTARLVKRCRTVEWLEDRVDATPEAGKEGEEEVKQGIKREDSNKSLEVGNAHNELARRMVGMSVHDGGESAVSVLAVAQHMVEPGLQTPSKSKTAVGIQRGYTA